MWEGLYRKRYAFGGFLVRTEDPRISVEHWTEIPRISVALDRKPHTISVTLSTENTSVEHKGSWLGGKREELTLLGDGCIDSP